MEKNFSEEEIRDAEKAADEKVKKEKAALDKAVREQEKAVDKSLSDIIKRHQQALDDLDRRREKYRQKLLSVGGDLFSVEEKKNEDGSTTKTYTVNNIEEQLRKMREYNANVKKLREQGMSDVLFDELTSLSSEDSAQSAKYLAGMSEAEFTKIKELYDAKQEAADELSRDLYKNEAQALSDGLNETLAGFAGEAYKYGVMSADEFVEGFNKTLEEKGFWTLDGQFTAAGANRSYTNYASKAAENTKDNAATATVECPVTVILDNEKVGAASAKYTVQLSTRKGV